MIKFDLRLEQETIESIKELAKKEERSVSSMARKILKEYFKTGFDPMKSVINIDGNKLQVFTRKK